MNIKGFSLVWFSLFLIHFSGFSHNADSLVRSFYASLNKGDSIEIVPYFHPTARIKHVGEDQVWDLSLQQFLKVSPKFKSDLYSEEIMRLEVRSFESGLTYADVHFDFYIEGSYSHSGIDHICYSTRGDLFRIESIYSSDFKENPKKKVTLESPDELMDQWHLAAAQADFDSFFNFMSADFIYLGTDPSERWTKKTFALFCQPYFDQGKAWDFKPNWRNWYYSEDHKTAWFEESLDTWMEECRGSGVLILEDGQWKIAHYNLTVLIENEKMKKFLKLRRK